MGLPACQGRFSSYKEHACLPILFLPIPATSTRHLMYFFVRTLIVFSLVATACSSGDPVLLAEGQERSPFTIDGSGVVYEDGLTDGELSSEIGLSGDPGSNITRNQRVLDAAPACAQVESGFLALLQGDAEAARPRLIEGSTLASKTGSEQYEDLGAELAAAVDNPTLGEAVQTAADQLLVLCAADGFERLG